MPDLEAGMPGPAAGDGGRNPLDRLREALAGRALVTWEGVGHGKPRLVVTFPEDAGPGDAVDALERALPGTREAPASLALDGGWAWREVDTPEAARRAADDTGNRVDLAFARDALPNGTLRDGRCYHALCDGTGRAAVVVAVGGRGRWGAPDGPYAVGVDGSDPYPEHSSRIRALADGVGFPLPRECHPLYRTVPDMRESFHPARLAPHAMARARDAARAIAVPVEELLGVLVAEALDARDLAR